MNWRIPKIIFLWDSMSLRNFTVFSEHRDLVEEFKKKKKTKIISENKFSVLSNWSNTKNQDRIPGPQTKENFR